MVAGMVVGSGHNGAIGGVGMMTLFWDEHNRDLRQDDDRRLGKTLRSVRENRSVLTSRAGFMAGEYPRSRVSNSDMNELEVFHLQRIAQIMCKLTPKISLFSARQCKT